MGWGMDAYGGGGGDEGKVACGVDEGCCIPHAGEILPHGIEGNVSRLSGMTLKWAAFVAEADRSVFGRGVQV